MGEKNNIDRMTGKDRMKGLILGKPIDRVPFMPFFVSYMAINNGISLYDFYTKPDVAFRAGVETMNKYPWATIRPVHGWGDHGAWEFGGKIEWPKDEISMSPHTPESLITTPEEVDKLPDPDPLETGWFRLRNQFNDICVKKGFSASLPSGSIMGQMASILGATNLMLWMIDYPDAFHRLAEKVLNFNMKMAKMTIEKYGGGNCSVMTDLALESNKVISPRMVEMFCLPYTMRLHGFYLESGVRGTMLHLCSDHKDNLRYWKQVPLPDRTIFSLSEVQDLKETGEFLGDKYIIAGNVPTAALQNGTQEDVIRETKRCLEKGKGLSGGFILMPACEWPPNAPPENLEAVRKAIMEFGFY